MAYHEKFNANLHWLVTGKGPMIVDADRKVADIPLPDIKTYIEVIAATLWEKAPPDTTPDVFASQFLNVFNRLMTKDNLAMKDIPGAVKFAIAELDTTANEDKRKK